MSMLWIQWLCSYCWSLFEFMDILSGIRISHRIYKTCNSLTCKLLYANLLPNCLSISVVDGDLCFKPTYCFGSITTAVVLGVLYTIANKFQPLPEDVYHYGINLFGLVISPTSCTNSFLFYFHHIDWQCAPKMFPHWTRLQNHELKKNWHDIMLLYNLNYVSQWDNRFRW